MAIGTPVPVELLNNSIVLLAGPNITSIGVVELLLGLVGFDEMIEGAGSPTFKVRTQFFPANET